ncbi:7-cyano-7-deazaguanine synthase, partial [bacterium]|nr:7-cyano-7-deazaguanine synthase [bacterium]
ILVVESNFFRQIGGSALTDDSIPIPTKLSNGIPVTYVPFRNANILSMAVSWAEVIEAKRVFIGAVEEDSSGYPDCRETFFSAFNEMISKGTKPGSEIRIEAPLLHSKKSEIVKMGFELGVPFNLTWSCYQSQSQACGVCDSCRLRLKGFSDAQVKDPIPYVDG